MLRSMKRCRKTSVKRIRVQRFRKVVRDMEITKDTKLKDLISTYPWLKDEMAKLNDKFKMLNTPVGKVMLGKATMTEMSKKSGMDADALISGILDLIKAHK